MVPKVEDTTLLPAHHLHQVLDIALLIHLAWLQLGYLGPVGRHGVRVEAAEWPGPQSHAAVRTAQGRLLVVPVRLKVETRLLCLHNDDIK